ncbi:hypothetical protein CLU79DRAFT_737566 [Phycomyces nitens]|nr:hypothetical protein CLU79DRAFT_737566 [Phycomyces nitens]
MATLSASTTPETSHSAINSMPSQHIPQRKKKATRACIHCQKAHLTCDDSRPCQRCIKRDLASTCADGARKKAKYLQDAEDLKNRASLFPPATIEGFNTQDTLPNTGLLDTQSFMTNDANEMINGSQLMNMDNYNYGFGSSATNLEYSILSSMLGSPMDLQLTQPPVNPIVANVRATQPHPVVPTTTPTPSITSGVTGGWPNTVTDSRQPLQQLHQQQLQHQHQHQQKPQTQTQTQNHHNQSHQHKQHGSPNFTLPDTRPLQTPSLPTTPSSFTSGNQSIMDDILFPPRSIGSIPSAVLNSSHISSSGISSMLPYGDGAVVAKIASPVTAGAAVKRRNQIITPEMAYASATKPFSYAEGYHYLINYVRQKMSREDLMRISRALALFRPSVLASMMNLTEDDLIFTEKCLQRKLLEYEKLISYSGTPTVVWRRTGEIALVGKEFSLLTQWSRDALLNKKTYIYELMSDASAVEYWEKYALHAFDNTDSAVYSSCILISPTKRLVPCTFCFTIKRDIFDLPSVIVGNFLPILS